MHIIIAPKDVNINLGLTLRRYIAFGEDAANIFDGKTFKKAFHANGGLHLLSLFKHQDGVAMQVEPGNENVTVSNVAKRIARKLLGLHCNLDKFYQFAQGDPVLSELTKKYAGARPTLSVTPFEMLVTSITAQQINLQFAFTTRSRLIRAYGDRLNLNGNMYFAFPEPDVLAQADVATLREMQFSTRKAEYIIGIAKAIVSGELDVEALENLPDEEICETLTKLRGIGQWTVDWYLARFLGRGTAFAAGDLGVRKAVEHYYFNGEKQSQEKLREFAKRWGEFTNLVVHYLLLGFYSGE